MSEKLSFEAAMSRLDEVVKQLEAGDAPLDKSLALFEEGTGLIKECSRMLDEAEQKVVMLTRGADGTPEVHEFTEGEQ